VSAIRDSLHMSRKAFCDAFGFSIRTLEKWERGERLPESPARAYLTVIANNYPEITWLKPAGYSVLGLLGMGLVSKGMHWYSDLPLGFFIGYSMGNIISPRIKLKSANNSDLSQLMLSPDLYNKRIGMRLAYSF
ncbi:MAG: hypothetical protein P4L45_00175, partial [Ignavibacteriaceae bacterium]|nr:hypothetical protein [Ignavibacteriaceae bacterium]